MHHCREDEDWRDCACDKGFKIPEHGMFIQSGNWFPIREKVPIFSPGSVPECFLDIVYPSDMFFHTIPFQD